MSCDWGFAADSIPLARKRDERDVAAAPEPPVVAMPPARQVSPHPTWAPCAAAPERTSEGQIGQQKQRAGYRGFLPATSLPLGDEHVDADGSAGGHSHVSVCEPAVPAPTPGPARRGATRIRACPKHGPMSDHPTRGPAGTATFASRRRRPTTTDRPPTIARRGRLAPVGASFSWLSRRCC